LSNIEDDPIKSVFVKLNIILNI